MKIHYQPSVCRFSVPCRGQLAIRVEYPHVQEWDAVVLFTFNGELQGGMEIVDLVELVLDRLTVNTT